MSVFDDVIGQDSAVAELKRAALDAAKITMGERGDAMTHAWLITGPPGSGRSTSALAFAAALVCAQGGCGTCIDCRNVATGSHPDVEHVIPNGVVYTVDDADQLIERTALTPRRGPWHIFVVEDVDRFQLNATPKLLKAIEEPPPQTVWILCAPTVDDLLPTIVSRCRQVHLVTPSLAFVAEQLMNRFGVDEAMATFAARVAQGHIGRARALATDEQVRMRRSQVLEIPSKLNNVSSCFTLANLVVSTVNADTETVVVPLEQQDEADVRTVYGDGTQGFKSVDRAIKREMKSLEDRWKARRRRITADQYDRVLLDLTGFYRDVLVVQAQSQAPLINEELLAAIEFVAMSGDSDATLRKVDAIYEARDQLLANVHAPTVFESLFVALRDPSLVNPR
ncbi:MAG: DNA polymerase III subunit delta' [Actinomycetes bacterium]